MLRFFASDGPWRLALLLVAMSVPSAACSAPLIPGFDGVDGVKYGPKKKSSTGDDSASPSVPLEETDGPSQDSELKVPALFSVTPDSATVGSSEAVELTLSGARFVVGSQVDLDGRLLDATLISPTELRAKVPAELLSVARMLRLVVVAKGAGESNPLSFTVANPSSVSLSSLTPPRAVVGAEDVALTVTGSGFITTSTIRFNGASLPTTFRSATELGATIPKSALLDAGNVSVTVTNGSDVVSLPISFEVANPAPVATSLSPNKVSAGSGALVVRVQGNGFTRASEVVAGQTSLVTTFESTQSLRATLPASLVAAAKNLAITVKTPSPGGGTSSSLSFSVTAPQQTGCEFACADYGFSAGECYEGWSCNGATGCLEQKACTAGVGAQCAYRCSDYGFMPGQCTGGWICIPEGQYAGCLGQTKC